MSQEELAELWGADLYRDLSLRNELDLELFALAECEVLRRLNLVPQAESRLRDFRNRCLQLEAVAPTPESLHACGSDRGLAVLPIGLSVSGARKSTVGGAGRLEMKKLRSQLSNWYHNYGIEVLRRLR